MWQTLFKSGELLLQGTPSPEPAPVEGLLPLSGAIMLFVFLALAIIQLKRFLLLAPYLADSLFRARGSSTLENSVRFSRDRNQQAHIFILLFVLVMYRYRLYTPGFLDPLNPDLRLLGIFGIVVGCIALRQLVFLVFRPRRHYDIYLLAYRIAYNYFIFLGLVVIAELAFLALLRASDQTVWWFILMVSALIYLLFLFRKAQILSLFCNPLRTFLYLCGLELVPTGVFVALAVI